MELSENDLARMLTGLKRDNPFRRALCPRCVGTKSAILNGCHLESCVKSKRPPRTAGLPSLAGVLLHFREILFSLLRSWPIRLPRDPNPYNLSPAMLPACQDSTEGSSVNAQFLAEPCPDRAARYGLTIPFCKGAELLGLEHSFCRPSPHWDYSGSVLTQLNDHTAIAVFDRPAFLTPCNWVR